MYAQGTKVPVIQSRGEIERLLGKHKCSQFMCGTDYALRPVHCATAAAADL
jgi:hypothetical protein